MPRPRYWILQTGPHITETYIPPEGDVWSYSVAPDFMMRRGDIVYLWLNYRKYLYGWGEVMETPQIIFEDLLDGETKLKRQRVIVERKKGFHPSITDTQLQANPKLRRIIPPALDDLYALRITDVQAGYLSDFIRENDLEAPKVSAPVRWLSQETAPQFIVQALLTFGDKTSEGRLVEAVRIPWYEIIKIITKDPNEIYKIDPFKWEEIVAGGYERDGFEVELTPRSGDKGRDIIATKNGLGSIRIFDQVKRYRLSNRVGADEVRALVGVLSMANNVSKGIISTTSTFAPDLLEDPYIASVHPYRLELRPRDVLLPWLESFVKD